MQTDDLLRHSQRTTYPVHITTETQLALIVVVLGSQSQSRDRIRSTSFESVVEPCLTVLCESSTVCVVLLTAIANMSETIR